MRLDPTITTLDIADFVTIGAALFCGWQLGEWWGVCGEFLIKRRRVDGTSLDSANANGNYLD